MKITLTFKKPGYIAHPYRTEMFDLIEIQKQSGMMRARSEKKKRECLETALSMKGMTLDAYKELERKANEPFYVNDSGFIVIPSASVSACLVNANDEAPSRLRIQNLRVAVRPSDFVTTKKKPDGTWTRFAVVKSGMGKLSNQRGIRKNEYIENFTAKGEIDYNPEFVKPDAIRDLLEYAGKNVGIGASRKMGYGRFAADVPMDD